MRNLLKRCVALVLVTTLFVPEYGAFSQNSRAAELTFSRGGYVCGLSNSRWMAGSIKAGTFTSFAQQIRTLKSKLKNTFDAGKKAKLEKQVAAITKKNAAGNKVCKSGPDATSPTATPTSGPGGGDTPAPTPTPTRAANPTATPTRAATATPTPTPAQASCPNASGDAPSPCFGIPAGFSGNVSRGQSAWFASGCEGCHSSAGKRGMSYSRVSTAFSRPDMAGVARPGTSSLADIVAYLNR